MPSDSTTDVTAGSYLTPEDADHLNKLMEQLWMAVVKTRDPIALQTHQAFVEFRRHLTGQED